MSENKSTSKHNRYHKKQNYSARDDYRKINKTNFENRRRSPEFEKRNSKMTKKDPKEHTHL